MHLFNHVVLLCASKGLAIREAKLDRFPRLEPRSTRYEEGTSCADAFGQGYISCVHYDTCFNPGIGQICCYDGRECPFTSGKSVRMRLVLTVLTDHCNAGEYCAQDSYGNVVCCQGTDTLQECGASAIASTVAPSAAVASASAASMSAAPAGSSSSSAAGPAQTAGAAAPKFGNAGMALLGLGLGVNGLM